MTNGEQKKVKCRVLRNSLKTILSFFFFSSRRRHTRLRRDWSSDVCSSDLTYSKNQKTSDVKITSIKKNKKSTEFLLFINKNIIDGIGGKYKFKINLLGEHNILNATGAIIASLLAKVSIQKIQQSLRNFEGVKRRFSYLGNIQKAAIYDDYAHHPSEKIGRAHV